MNKELQDLTWSVLPKEFKEEVKKIYLNAVEHHPCGYNHKTDLLKYLFGIHNLTSDAEGEDNLQERLWNMLSPRLQTYCLNMGCTSHDGNVEDVLEHLFGSKCLPDVPSSESRDCDNPLADKDGCRWCNDGKCAFNNACYFEPLNPQELKLTELKEDFCQVEGKINEQVGVATFASTENYDIKNKVLNIGDKVTIKENNPQSFFAGIEIDNILKECKIPIRYYSFLSLCIIGAVALGMLISIITVSLVF